MVSFPSPTMIKTNGIDMAVYEGGPRDGIPLVLCHGFPELAYSWRHQIPALAEAGYHVLAPDQRGYGLSSRPAGVAQYDIEHLTGDMAGLLDRFGIEKAIFCGHDWGGVVAWHMPLLQEKRVRGVIGVNTPFLPRRPIDPIMYLRAQYGDDMYIVRFQEADEPDAILEKDVGRTFRFFMRKNTITQEEYQSGPKEQRNLALFRALAQPESDWRGEPLLTPAELKVFVDTFKRTGFTGCLNWYRNMKRNWEYMANVEEKVKVPGLMILAEDDFILRPSLADGMETYVPDLEKALIRGCGHWTQQEYPYRTNAIVVDWLKRRFIK